MIRRSRHRIVTERRLFHEIEVYVGRMDRARISGTDLVNASRRVLGVDDYEDSAELLARHIDLRGHRVGVASNTRDALSIARELAPPVA